MWRAHACGRMEISYTTHIKERAHRRLRAAAAYPFSGLSPAKSGVHYPSRTVQRLERIDLEQLSAQAAGVEPANVLTFQRKTSHAPQEPAIQRLCARSAPGVPCPDAAYPLSGLSPAIKGGCTYAHAPGQPAAGEHNGCKRNCVYGEPPGCHISKHIEIHNRTNTKSYPGAFLHTGLSSSPGRLVHLHHLPLRPVGVLMQHGVVRPVILHFSHHHTSGKNPFRGAPCAIQYLSHSRITFYVHIIVPRHCAVPSFVPQLRLCCAFVCVVPLFVLYVVLVGKSISLPSSCCAFVCAVPLSPSLTSRHAPY